MGSDDDTHVVPAASDASVLAAGSEIAGHRIEAEVGRGGMGVVYRAVHLALGTARALKVITPGLGSDPRFRERFKRESRLAASIEHPGVIPVHDAGEDAGLLYISMRLVEGRSLQQEVAEHGPLDPARAGEVIGQVGAALDAAHAVGLVHRDVKPSNVLLEGDRVFLTDFGISRPVSGEDTLTATGEVLGSPDYSSPEQAEGEGASAASDIYSLGAVICFALTGSPPFDRDTPMAKLYAHANAPRPLPSQVAPWLPAGIDCVVAKAMAIPPAERYSSGAELAAAVRDALASADGPPTPRPEASLKSGGEPTGSRLGWKIALILAAAAAIGLAAALVLGGGDDGREDGTVPAADAVATIGVGAEPNGVAVGDGETAGVWVGSRGAEAVYRIDPGTERAEEASGHIPGGPTAVDTGFGSVWAVNGPRAAVVRVDPSGDDAQILIPTGADPSDVAVDERWVWVTNEDEDTVVRIDPETNAVTETVPVGASPRAIATGDGAVWVANIDGQSVSEIDPATATTVGRPISVGQRPNDLAVGEGSVWVIDFFEGSLRRIDPDAQRVEGEPYEVEPKPRSVKVGFGSLWIANGDDDSVSRIDPATGNEQGEPVPVGDEPSDLAVGPRSVWSSDFGSSTVTRIDPG